MTMREFGVKKEGTSLLNGRGCEDEEARDMGQKREDDAGKGSCA